MFSIDPFRDPETGTPPARVWPFVLTHIRPLRRVVATSLAFAVIGGLLEVWLIYYAGRVVDMLASTSRDELWAEYGTELLLAAALILLVYPAVAFGHEALDDIAFRPTATAMIRWRAHRHVLGQSVGWFQNDLAGRIATRVRDIGDSATGVAYTALHALSVVGVYIAGSFWLLGAADVRLLVPLTLWVALYAGLMAYAVPRFRVETERFQDAESALTGTLVDTYTNIDTVKLYAEPGHDDRAAFAAVRAAHVRLQRLEVTINVGMFTLGTILMVGLTGYAIVLWRGGDAPIGLIASAIAVSFRINFMADWLLGSTAALFGYLGATRESLKTVAQPLAVPDAPDARDLAVEKGAIQLTGVHHHYGKGDGGLDGVTLHIAGGEKVGLVGRSGAGKSTLVNLILRFHEAERGRIEIDGQDIRGVTQDSLRRHIATVGQDAVLLHRSVWDNVTLGRDVDPSAVDAAVRRAAAEAFIPGLRDRDGRRGFDAHVGERGVKLSGGQRQRIALARAILKDAPILVLDEATSALDSEVEAAIQDTLYEVMEGKTVIAIAHRLSTIARMDRIVVLDEGRVVEEGTHGELLAGRGVYAGLWARQVGGFIA